MSVDKEAAAFEQRLLAEEARQKKLHDDAALQAIISAKMQQQIENLQGQSETHYMNHGDLKNLVHQSTCAHLKALEADTLPSYCD